MRIWCYFFGVIVWVRVVLRKTVVGDCRFDYLRGSHLQSQEYRFPLVGSPSNNHKLPTTALFVPMLHQFRVAFLWEGKLAFIVGHMHPSFMKPSVQSSLGGCSGGWLVAHRLPINAARAQFPVGDLMPLPQVTWVFHLLYELPSVLELGELSHWPTLPTSLLTQYGGV